MEAQVSVYVVRTWKNWALGLCFWVVTRKKCKMPVMGNLQRLRKWQGKLHHNAENVIDCWSEELGMAFSVAAILKSRWSALELMQGVKCTGEWPSSGLFALETHLWVWFSATVWMDFRLLLLELCCSSPGALEAGMDPVGWEGDTSTTLLLLMPGIDSHYCQRCKDKLKKKEKTALC